MTSSVLGEPVSSRVLRDVRLSWSLLQESVTPEAQQREIQSWQFGDGGKDDEPPYTGSLQK